MSKFIILFIFNLSDTIDVPYFKNAKIILDGKLEEDIYKEAQKITEFIQTEPVPFQSPPESLVAYIFQNNEGLILGFHCITKEREPDKSLQGDEIQVFLDTYLDRENAYMFAIKANGEKGDARFTSGGEKFDYWVELL
ncbi:MAG: hypothetical protein NC833_07245 [Candidatus Omnitrophica bacterium]|nr:hypothetical protein [Candidatus Omnitrophota bacterium]